MLLSFQPRSTKEYTEQTETFSCHNKILYIGVFLKSQPINGFSPLPISWKQISSNWIVFILPAPALQRDKQQSTGALSLWTGHISQWLEELYLLKMFSWLKSRPVIMQSLLQPLLLWYLSGFGVLNVFISAVIEQGCTQFAQLNRKAVAAGNQTEISEITDYQNIPHLVNVLLMGWMHFCLFVCLVLFCLHSQVSWSITLFLTTCRLKITSWVKSLAILVSFDAFCNDLIVARSHEVKEDNKTCCFQNVIPQISQEPASDPGCVSTLAGCTLAWGNL